MGKADVLKLKNQLKREHRIIGTMEVLKQIAVSEFQFLEKERREASKFILMLESFFSFYKRYRFEGGHLFESPCKTPAVVAISSDEGFMGALNNQIVERAVRFYEENPDTKMIVVGRRGARKVFDFKRRQPRVNRDGARTEFPDGQQFGEEFQPVAERQEYAVLQ